MRFLTDKDSDLLNNEFIDKFFDYPYSKMGRNMQRMKTDIVETKDGYNIYIDIPGFNKNDIKVHIGDSYLTVYVKKDEVTEDEAKDGRYVYRERFLGTMSRSFYIGNIKETDIKANYKNGTLKLEYPKERKTEKEKTWIKVD